MESVDLERRFGGMTRLYGPDAAQRLRRAHIAVAGIGGVGSWCAEALARSGVGTLTLVDLDNIAESNVNRQLHALTNTLGQSKVQAMRERIAQIHPGCMVKAYEDFVESGNAAEVIGDDVQVLIDCTDQISAKIAMILLGRQRRMPVIVCGGAGGKTDPLLLRSGDLSRAANDALLAKLRNTLRRQHGFPRAGDAAGKVRKRIPPMQVRCFWFDQPALLPDAWLQGGEQDAPQGLSCAGYGSAVAVTAAMGFAAANDAMQCVMQGRPSSASA